MLVIFNSLAGWIFDHTIKAFPSPFPKAAAAGGLISRHDLGSVGVMLVVLGLLYSTARLASKETARVAA